MRILRYDDSIPINLNNLTAIEIKSMDTSEAVKHAKRLKVFRKCSANSIIVPVQVAFIYNMNLGELHDGEDGDGGFNVQVFNHKTDYKGAVNIHISQRAR